MSSPASYDSVLSREERATFALRALYAGCGYSRYKMSKFEEYDLYARNKDFLVSDNIITFTDTDGRLLALKPDVTLSIVKNSRAAEGLTKVFYNENVYRVSGSTKNFREIMQVGLECIGDVGSAEIGEVLSLANGRITVACGEGSVELLTVLPEGKKRMSAADFINGRKILVGDQLQ